jgi:hypothetical protein
VGGGAGAAGGQGDAGRGEAGGAVAAAGAHAGGGAGLQDLIGDKLVLRVAVPVPGSVLAGLAEAVDGPVDHLRDLGLLDAFEDVVDPWVTALALNGSPVGRVGPLSAAERARRRSH